MDLLFTARECAKAKFPTLKVISVAREIRKKEKVEGFAPLKLSILATSNIDFLAPALEVAAYADRIHLKTWTAGFNQVDQEVLNPQSELYAFAPQITLLYIRPEDIVPKFAYNLEDVDEQQLNEWKNEIGNKITNWTTKLAEAGIKTLFFSFVQPPYTPLGIRDVLHPNGQYAIWKKLNALLLETAIENTAVNILDLESLIRRIGFNNWIDPKMWSLAKIAGGTKFVADFVSEIMPVIRETGGRRKKCLVLDLDNTLWGGIIGEDGIGGVKLGGDYPGNVYREFHKRIVDLWKRGVILAINSKNNFEDAKVMFDSHPEMGLKLDHFAVTKINWTDKSENLKAISDELIIGLDSFVFVDDNPVECQRIASVHPEVTVFQVPASIELLPMQFSEITKLFDGILLSEEDKQRNQMYKQNQIRHEEQEKVSNIEEFLGSLEMIAEVDVLNKGNFQRVVQLLQKTNQFNVTTKRHSEQFVTTMMDKKEWLTYVVRLKDKYGDNGIVLVALVQVTGAKAVIDTFLMSCRVIGRTLEQVVMREIVKDLKEIGVQILIGEFIPTAKNKLVENLFPDLGFSLMENISGIAKYHLPVTDYQFAEKYSYITMVSTKKLHE
jgi:FkbH-like protein